MELVIVFSILGILGVAASGFYTNYSKGVEISTTAQVISQDLRQMQSKSMTGESGLKWGVHFVNGATSYYELFSTPTDYSDGGKVVTTTNTLPGSVTFSDPGASSSKDIIFSKITGSASASSVTITSNGVNQTISVAAIGTVAIGNSYGNVITGTSYNITALSGSNGSISPSGVTVVASGGNQAYSISPSAGYSVATLTVDGAYVTPANSYTFSSVGAPHTINVTFVLTPIVPILASPTQTSIAGTSATLGANLTSLGIPASVSARGTCYGTSPAPTGNCVAEGGTSTGVFTQSRTGLTAGTLYYYRGYATNATGTGYSVDDSFTTIIIPTLTTPTKSSVASTSATLGANLTSLGIPASVSARGTCYGTLPAPTGNCVAEGGTSTGVFTQSRTGLTAGTLYYYRGYATNTTGTAYSADDSFTTLIVPTVTTPTSSSVAATSAIIGANVTSLGNPSSISARGTCYGTSPAPVTNCTTEGSTTTGIFTQSISSLTPSTVYYYRGYATNTTGTAYSVDGTFTTTSSCTANQWGGISSGGYCWYRGSSKYQDATHPNDGASCSTICSYNGMTCASGNWNDDSSCTIMKAVWPAKAGQYCGNGSYTAPPEWDWAGVMVVDVSHTPQSCSALPFTNERARLCACQ